MVCEGEAGGEIRDSLDTNPSLNSGNASTDLSMNSSMKELKRKEKALGLDETLLEYDDHGATIALNRHNLELKAAANTVAASSSSAKTLPPPGAHLLTKSSLTATATATPGLAAKLDQLFSQQQLSNSPHSASQGGGQGVAVVASPSPVPDRSSTTTSTPVSLATPPPLTKGNISSFLLSRCSLQLSYPTDCAILLITTLQLLLLITTLRLPHSYIPL